MNMNKMYKRYLDIALLLSERSCCIRRHYGAIIVSAGFTIVSAGFNDVVDDAKCNSIGYCLREKLNIPKGERYELCVAGDSVIKLLNGEYHTIKELSENCLSFWTYAIDTQNGCIVPVEAKLPRFTGKRSDLIRITFDNHKSIVCTSDHKLLMSDCSYKRAEELSIYDSVMPMYYNFSMNNGYESICNTISMRKGRLLNSDYCNTESYPTHHLVYEFFNGALDFQNGKYLLHHIDGNKLNNIPDNLQFMSRGEHTMVHMNEERIEKFRKSYLKGIETCRRKLEEDPEFRLKKVLAGHKSMSNNWANPEFRKMMLEVNRQNGFTNVSIMNSPENRYKQVQGRIMHGLSLLLGKMSADNNFTELTVDNYTLLRSQYVSDDYRIIPSLSTILKWYDSFDIALEQAKKYNHRVIKLERLNQSMEVYDVTVPKYHNFPIDLGDNSCVFVSNCKSCHAEQQALINADPIKMVGGTIFIAGRNVTDNTIADSSPCLICRRMLKFAKLYQAVYAMPDKENPYNYTVNIMRLNDGILTF